VYSDGTEPVVIERLREADALVLSLVAMLRGEVVGHVALSDVGPPAQPGWLALGPLSVEPTFQRRSIGGQLIRAGLRALRERGAKGCVLLGDHRYYGRFGLVLVPELAPPEYPSQHLQVLRFGESFPTARMTFHPAFSSGESW
jgi:putative acetyltransferase